MASFVDFRLRAGETLNNRCGICLEELTGEERGEYQLIAHHGEGRKHPLHRVCAKEAYLEFRREYCIMCFAPCNPNTILTQDEKFDLYFSRKWRYLNAGLMTAGGLAGLAAMNIAEGMNSQSVIGITTTVGITSAAAALTSHIPNNQISIVIFTAGSVPVLIGLIQTIFGQVSEQLLGTVPSYPPYNNTGELFLASVFMLFGVGFSNVSPYLEARSKIINRVGLLILGIGLFQLSVGQSDPNEPAEVLLAMMVASSTAMIFNTLGSFGQSLRDYTR